MPGSLALYLALFAILALPWLRVADRAIPWGNPWVFADDARLVIWVLSWVAHAIATDPSHLLEGNINYPAPAQLTSSEHFATSQILFAPVYLLTGNPVLAANVLVFASYPLAALAMERLLLTLGCGRAAAWVGGLAFALGPLRVPANLQLPQYFNLYLPLVALCLVQLREAPRPSRAVALGLAYLLGIFSSYYMAAFLSLTAVTWLALELLRPRSARFRFLALAAGAMCGALLLLGVASFAYLGRPEARGITTLEAGRPVRALRGTLVALWMVSGTLLGGVPVILATPGIAALVPRSPARRIALAGLVLVVVGLVAMFPGAALVALLNASPLRFLRARHRFMVISGFGMALLTGAALHVLTNRVGPRVGAAAALSAVALLAFHGSRLCGTALDEIHPVSTDARVYRKVARITAAVGRGALLELPLDDAHPPHPWLVPWNSLEPDAMVGSTQHWLPLLNGHTGHDPPHRALLLSIVHRLPSRDALLDLVDTTHVRWLLLHPREHWREATDRDRLLALPDVTTFMKHDDWVLAKVLGKPSHPAWFQAIVAAPEPGKTVLGTPLGPIPEEAAVAKMRPLSIPGYWPTSGLVWLSLIVTNTGTAQWPVSTFDGSSNGTVQLVGRWSRNGGAADAEGPGRLTFVLPRDVPAHEVVLVPALVRTPTAPGTYDLELHLEQQDGARFDGPGNEPLRLPITVVAANRPDPPPTAPEPRTGAADAPAPPPGPPGSGR